MILQVLHPNSCKNSWWILVLPSTKRGFLYISNWCRNELLGQVPLKPSWDFSFWPLSWALGWVPRNYRPIHNDTDVIDEGDVVVYHEEVVVHLLLRVGHKKKLINKQLTVDSTNIWQKPLGMLITYSQNMKYIMTEFVLTGAWFLRPLTVHHTSPKYCFSLPLLDCKPKTRFFFLKSTNQSSSINSRNLFSHDSWIHVDPFGVLCCSSSSCYKKSYIT